MKIRAALAALAVLAAPLGAPAACKIGAVAELPVTMSGMRPLVPARIDGHEEMFLADSGAFYSVISPSTASELHLRLQAAPQNLLVYGIGGAASTALTRVKVFTLAGVPIPNLQFLVTSNVSDTDEAGLLGQNVLGLADVEYDLAGGMIRIIRATGCSNTVLAYWRKPNAPFSMMAIDDASLSGAQTSGSVKVNGVRFRATFDTGMSTSMLSVSAAARAGIRPTGAGVVDGGFVGGIGRGRVQTWVAPVDSLEIGDNEKVLHTRLRIGSLSALDTDMLIGSDFFLSHRVYVANSQHRLYYTYNGGSVFNLEVAPQRAPNTEPSAPPAAVANPADAAGFARLGAALASRQSYPEAIAKFSKAIELAPESADYRLQRARAYFESSQLAPGKADLDQALKLAPSNADALILRSEMRLSGDDNPGAADDLKAASAALPAESDRRLTLAELYESMDAMPAAIGELDSWVKSHREDNGLAEALSLRCWARALMGQELDKALSDCDASLRRLPNAANVLDSRGLVHLRLGDYTNAMSDYDRSLALRPKNAWSLYGRGMVKLKLGRAAEGKGDISAAEAIDPHVADQARKHGLTP